jgi:hypothetical protein
MVLGLATALLAASCATAPGTAQTAGNDDLTGTWKGKVQFKTGAFAAVTDLDFLYVFNAGGTMTESSNYDAAPPVTPAYGVWRKTGPRHYEAKYVYYWTKPPAALDEITKGGGWTPGGHGVLTQKITLSDDGNSFDSTIKYEVFDQAGRPTDPTREASANGSRIRFKTEDAYLERALSTIERSDRVILITYSTPSGEVQSTDIKWLRELTVALRFYRFTPVDHSLVSSDGLVAFPYGNKDRLFLEPLNEGEIRFSFGEDDSRQYFIGVEELQRLRSMMVQLKAATSAKAP